MDNYVYIDNTSLDSLKYGQNYKFNCIICNNIGKKQYRKRIPFEDILICTHCLKSRRFKNKPSTFIITEDNKNIIDNIPLRSVIYFKCEKCGKDTHKVKKRNFQFLCRNCLSKKFRIKHYGSVEKSYIAMEKTLHNTIKNKYGVENYFQSEDFKQKSKETCLNKYGVEYSFQSEIVKQKGKETKLKKYGNKNFNNRKKCKITCLNKYNVDNPAKKEKIKKKAMRTCLKKYGTISPSQVHDIRIKQQQKVIYDNLRFDSMYEVSYYKYLKDNNINFEYQPNIRYEYTFNNETHYYFPDFKISNEIIEIKGDHFFNKDGKMICPWDHNKDNLFEAKHQCMIKNNIKILTGRDLRNLGIRILKKSELNKI